MAGLPNDPPVHLPTMTEFLAMGVLPLTATCMRPSDGDICTICLEDLEIAATENVIVLTRCNHFFHTICACKWFLSNNARRGACPNCCRPLFYAYTPQTAEAIAADRAEARRLNNQDIRAFIARQNEARRQEAQRPPSPWISPRAYSEAHPAHPPGTPPAEYHGPPVAPPPPAPPLAPGGPPRLAPLPRIPSLSSMIASEDAQRTYGLRHQHPALLWPDPEEDAELYEELAHHRARLRNHVNQSPSPSPWVSRTSLQVELPSIWSYQSRQARIPVSDGAAAAAAAATLASEGLRRGLSAGVDTRADTDAGEMVHRECGAGALPDE